MSFITRTIQGVVESSERKFIIDNFVPYTNSQGVTVLPPFLKEILALLGGEVVAYLNSHEAEFIAAAQAAGTTGASALKAYINKIVAGDALLAPFASLIDAAIDAALPKLLAAAGGDEKLLYAAVLAYVSKELGYLSAPNPASAIPGLVGARPIGAD
jgi:hypothetical protein